MEPSPQSYHKLFDYHFFIQVCQHLEIKETLSKCAFLYPEHVGQPGIQLMLNINLSNVWGIGSEIWDEDCEESKDQKKAWIY